MASNIIQFEADLERFARQMDIDFGTVVRRVALDLHDRIVRRTPVDTGRARASWTLQVDQADPTTQPESIRVSAEEAARIAIMAAQSRIEALKANPFRQVWIANNLDYIRKLESGHSQQAPLGFVAISVAEVEAEIEFLVDA